MFEKYKKKYKEEQVKLKELQPKYDKIVDDYVAEENQRLSERANEYKGIFDKAFTFMGKQFTPIGVFKGSVYKSVGHNVIKKCFIIITKKFQCEEYEECIVHIEKNEPCLFCFCLEGDRLQEYRFDSEDKIEAVIKNMK